MKSHYTDLSNRAYNGNVYTFTEFLSLSEQEDLYSESKDFSPIPFSFDAGYLNGERKVCRFGDEESLGYEQEFPIVCICIEPRSKKFMTQVSHRDYLGALMNLGLERKCFGDIIIQDTVAYVFVLERNAQFVLDELNSIGRNPVKCKIVEYKSVEATMDGKDVHLLVASMRADGIIAKVFNLSRKDVASLFFEKKIAVNGRLVENNDKQLTVGDVVSVRGFGKFKVSEGGNLSKKGKINLDVIVYK